MDRVKKLVPFWKRVWYKWKSYRGVPFRKSYFVGYDLKGNTYWENYTSRNKRVKPRRIWHPYQQQMFIFDYFDKLPIQWLQWLRFSRYKAPTVQELVDDEKRLARIKKLVKLRGEELEYKKASSENAMVGNMFSELQKVENQEANEKAIQEKAIADAEREKDKVHS